MVVDRCVASIEDLKKLEQVEQAAGCIVVKRAYGDFVEFFKNGALVGSAHIYRKSNVARFGSPIRYTCATCKN